MTFKSYFSTKSIKNSISKLKTKNFYNKFSIFKVLTLLANSMFIIFTVYNLLSLPKRYKTQNTLIFDSIVILIGLIALITNIISLNFDIKPPEKESSQDYYEKYEYQISEKESSQDYYEAYTRAYDQIYEEFLGEVENLTYYETYEDQVSEKDLQKEDISSQLKIKLNESISSLKKLSRISSESFQIASDLTSEATLEKIMVNKLKDEKETFENLVLTIEEKVKKENRPYSEGEISVKNEAEIKKQTLIKTTHKYEGLEKESKEAQKKAEESASNLAIQKIRHNFIKIEKNIYEESKIEEENTKLSFYEEDF